MPETRGCAAQSPSESGDNAGNMPRTRVYDIDLRFLRMDLQPRVYGIDSPLPGGLAWYYDVVVPIVFTASSVHTTQGRPQPCQAGF